MKKKVQHGHKAEAKIKLGLLKPKPPKSIVSKKKVPLTAELHTQLIQTWKSFDLGDPGLQKIPQIGEYLNENITKFF